MRNLVRFLTLLAMAVPGVRAAADDVALLRRVADSWLGERDRWAFNQRVVEYDGKVRKQERVESYDPSRGSASRWLLVSIDSRRPTPAEWQQWYDRKYRKTHRSRGSVADKFDFANARILEETTDTVRYELPLRGSVEWVFPINKVELIVTISKRGPALEQVHARISEPFKVALGLARILDIDLDVQMEPPPPQTPAEARPSGSARAVVSRFGDRVEYYWTGFRRVGAGHAPAGPAVE